MEDEPRRWSAEDVDAFASEADPEETVAVILELAAAPDADSLRVLALFLGTRHHDTFFKATPSRAAVHALVSLGEAGVQILYDALVRDDERRVRYKAAIIEALYRASRGEPLPWAPAAPPIRAIEELQISEGAQAAAASTLRDVLADSIFNPDLFFTVTQFMFQGQMKAVSAGEVKGEGDAQTAADDADFGRDIVELLAESSIRLSRSTLAEYEALLASGASEESYQQFLANNPVFLDPLSTAVISKQRLGLEYATDYAVRRLDGRWLLVEIEKPQNRIFTQAYDFTAEFTHGFGQVLDFQNWVDENVAYAQRQMAGITVPRGLLVIGMRSELDDRAQGKLRRYVDNSTRIDVATFDDLLVGAQNLYATLHRERDA